MKLNDIDLKSLSNSELISLINKYNMYNGNLHKLSRNQLLKTDTLVSKYFMISLGK